MESAKQSDSHYNYRITLATWSFSAQQQDWGERGRFVQVVIDPEAKEVIHQMGDEWHLLY